MKNHQLEQAKEHFVKYNIARIKNSFSNEKGMVGRQEDGRYLVIKDFSEERIYFNSIDELIAAKWSLD